MSYTRQNKKHTQTLESAQYGPSIHADGLDCTDDTSISPYGATLTGGRLREKSTNRPNAGLIDQLHKDIYLIS